MQARALLEVAPQGAYVILGGPQDDPLADDLRSGQQEALQAAVDGEAVTIVAEADIDAWIPANAQRDMAAILEAQPDGIGAILAADDRIATGAAEALAGAGRDPLPLAGGGGADAALNRIALGTQTVSIWRDPRILGKAAAEIALVLADGRDMSLIEGVAKWTTPSGTEVLGVLLPPVPVTRANLPTVVEAGWITQQALCAGVADDVPPCSAPAD